MKFPVACIDYLGANCLKSAHTFCGRPLWIGTKHTWLFCMIRYHFCQNNTQLQFTSSFNCILYWLSNEFSRLVYHTFLFHFSDERNEAKLVIGSIGLLLMLCGTKPYLIVCDVFQFQTCWKHNFNPTCVDKQCFKLSVIFYSNKLIILLTK